MKRNVAMNPSISYEKLLGLIRRANNDEKLLIADEWLRGNKVISSEQFHVLREEWNKMHKLHGVFKIVISCGSVKMDYMTGLSYKEALKTCQDAHWKHNYNNGCVWAMDIDW